MRLSVVLLATAAALFAFTPSACALGRDALWIVVRACVLDSHVTGSPWPCLSMNRLGTVAVIGDPKRRTQVLVTPTLHVAGIESPWLLTSTAPNYWRAAWAERSWLTRRARQAVPDADVGLAVNSLAGRTQDQLHIHLDCLRPSVRRAIDDHLVEVGERWAALPTVLTHRHRYRAMWLREDKLSTAEPFHLLAADPSTGGDLSAWTLVLAPASRPSGERGFVLLSHKADAAEDDLGAGEELLDHGCKGLRVAVPAP